MSDFRDSIKNELNGLISEGASLIVSKEEGKKVFKKLNKFD
ncbi:MAG: hypothetical protein A4E26_01870 [Methanobacterium sp. PtaU1.Bin097]|jgi:hypothetical protein|nr:MAG: hypothetical protein A4E26_01870 [Methanobacterium sp. PtaU1.Bin097]